MHFSQLVVSVQKIISDISYMVIATTDESSVPWNSPVYFNFDDECNLYWISYKDAKHSRNVVSNPKASIIIFDSTAPVWHGDGVYLQCDVTELADEAEIQKAIDVYYGGRHIPHGMDRKDVSDYVGGKPWRIYRASPYDISTLSRDDCEIAGYPIDQRTSAKSD